MDLQERVREVVEPLVSSLEVELVDVEIVGQGRARTLRLLVDSEGGVDLGAITEITRVVSPALDADDPFGGPYTLEVSSPGVERPLRLPAHFGRAVGDRVAVTTHEPVDGARRIEGTLVEAGEDGVTVEVDGHEIGLGYDQIAKARTVFEWGPAPKPGGGSRRKRRQNA